MRRASSPGQRKASQSLVEFAEKTFGAADRNTNMLKEAAPTIEDLISMRNTVEHADGYSGKLVISNFMLGVDRKIGEPTWHREKDGKAASEPSSIRADMESYIHNPLALEEDVLVSWASGHLQVSDMMRVAFILEDKRNPLCPVKWTVTATLRLEDFLSKAKNEKKPS
jgi:hypothetical protein